VLVLRDVGIGAAGKQRVHNLLVDARACMRALSMRTCGIRGLNAGIDKARPAAREPHSGITAALHGMQQQPRHASHPLALALAAILNCAHGRLENQLDDNLLTGRIPRRGKRLRQRRAPSGPLVR
jgi:hypothetical protein